MSRENQLEIRDASHKGQAVLAMRASQFIISPLAVI